MADSQTDERRDRRRKRHLSLGERAQIENQQWNDEAVEVWPWGEDGPSLSLAEWKRRQAAGDTAQPSATEG